MVWEICVVGNVCLLVHTRHHHRSQSPIDWCSWEFYGLLFISLHLSNFTHISRSHATVNDDEWCWLISFSLSLSLSLSWLLHLFFRGVILLKCYQWCVAIHYSFSRQSTLPDSACFLAILLRFIQSLARSALGIILIFDNDYESFAVV